MLSNKPGQGNGSSERPSFSPPPGYTLRFQSGQFNGNTNGFVLRNPEGLKVGFFRMSEGKTDMADVLADHLVSRTVYDTEKNRPSVLIQLIDSERRWIGALVFGRKPKGSIQELIERLANRPIPSPQ